MTSHTPRSRLLRDTRVLRRADEIVDAAASVFAARGFHGTSTQAIADVLGMRQASLYYYFPSKEAALQLVCEKGVDGFMESAEAIVAADAAPIDKLTRLLASHLAPNEVKRDYVNLHQRAALPPQTARRSTAQQPPHRGLLCRGDPRRHFRRQHARRPRRAADSAGYPRHVQQRDQLAGGGSSGDGAARRPSSRAWWCKAERASARRRLTQAILEAGPRAMRQPGEPLRLADLRCTTARGCCLSGRSRFHAPAFRQKIWALSRAVLGRIRPSSRVRPAWRRWGGR